MMVRVYLKLTASLPRDRCKTRTIFNTNAVRVIFEGQPLPVLKRRVDLSRNILDQTSPAGDIQYLQTKAYAEDRQASLFGGPYHGKVRLVLFRDHRSKHL